MHINTRYINTTRGTASKSLRMYLWWSLCTLYLHTSQVRFWGCTCGGVYVPCIYTRARWDFEDVPVVEFMSLVFTHMPGEILRMYLWWSLCPLYLHICQVRFWGCTSGEVYVPWIYTHARWDFEDVPVVEFMSLVFTHMPGEILRMYLWWSLCTLNLHVCQVRVTIGNPGLYCCTHLFQALINSLVFWFCLVTPVNMPDLFCIWSG